VVDIHALELPSDLAGDELQVRVGLSDPLTGVRLRTAAGDEAVVATVSLP
jgi:hypothetical protein